MKKYIFKSLTAVIIALALLLVNVAALLMPSYDMSKANSLKVSENTKKYLASLEDNVEIYVIEGALYDLKFEEFMREYAKASDKISLEFVSESDSAELFELCGYSHENKLSAYAVVVKSDNRAKLIDYYSLFYYQIKGYGKMSYSQYTQYYQMFSSSESYLSSLDKLVYESQYYFYGDALLTGVVEYVSLDIIPKAYMVTTHGVNSVSDGNFAKLLTAMGYEFGELAMSEGAPIPEDAGVIIINEPSEDLSIGEADALLAYLKSGGRLLMITDEAALDMPNLMSVADYYGVRAEKGRVAEVIEEKESFTLTPTLNQNHDIIASMGGYEPKFVNANALFVKTEGELRPAELITPLVVTSAEAYIEGAADKKQSFTLAFSVEEETAAGNTRLVWSTGADSFNGDIDSADSLALLIYSVAWLNKTYTTEVGTIDAVLYGESVMKVSENAVTFGIVLTLALVMAVSVTGAVVINKRKKA